MMITLINTNTSLRRHSKTLIRVFVRIPTVFPVIAEFIICICERAVL